MAEYRIGLDGITINRSIDLLLDFPEQSEIAHRRSALRSYYHALYQLVSAAVFGDRLVFDRDIVPGSVRQDRGADFMRMLDMAAGTTEPFVVFDEPPPPLELLEDEAAAKRIAESLSAVGRSVLGVSGRLWHDYIVRDCGNYLGRDPSLTRADVPPAEYVFADGKRDYFVTLDTDELVRPLLDEIKGDGLGELVKWCRPFAKEAADEALAEFCRRSIFAHILIGENVASRLDNEVQAELLTEVGEEQGVSDVWPCDTRQALLSEFLLRVPEPSKESLPDSKELSAVVPYALSLVLRHTSIRDPIETLIEGISIVRDLEEFRQLREILFRFRTSRGSTSREDLARITKEINKATNLRGTDSLQMSMSLSSFVSPRIAFNVLRPAGRWLGARLPRALRARWIGSFIAQEGGKDRVEERNIGRLKMILPNLGN